MTIHLSNVGACFPVSDGLLPFSIFYLASALLPRWARKPPPCVVSPRKKGVLYSRQGTFSSHIEYTPGFVIANNRHYRHGTAGRERQDRQSFAQSIRKTLGKGIEGYGDSAAEAQKYDGHKRKSHQSRGGDTRAVADGCDQSYAQLLTLTTRKKGSREMDGVESYGVLSDQVKLQ